MFEKYFNLHCALAFSTLICISPFFTYGYYGFFYFFALSLTLVCFLLKMKNLKVSMVQVLLSILIVVSLLFSLMVNIENNFSSKNFFILSIPFFIIFSLISHTERIQVVDCFVKLYSLLLAISIFFSLALMLGLKSYIPSYLMAVEHSEFVVYGFTVVRTTLSWDFGSGLFHRFHGFFMEPGFVGTISAFVIIGYRFNLKNKYVLVSLLGGMISTSFAFYTILTLYLLCIMPLRGVLLVCLIALALVYIDHPFTNQLIIERLIDGGDKLNNRNSIYEYQQIEIFLKILNEGDLFKILFSYGDVVPGSTGSYRYVLLSLGLLPIVLIVTFYFFIIYRDFIALRLDFFTYEGVVINGLYVISLYQRPYVDNFYMLVLFYIINIRGGLMISKATQNI
ncbi:hypothetical protein [Aeromonas veronii]|uniref:hypothetical protein n=1 Tax=Aeromonas veronii TaxID=654 RepID=UPI003BA21885